MSPAHRPTPQRRMVMRRTHFAPCHSEPNARSPMHVLITGGTGFIGAALCRALLARGDRVSVWTRSAAAATARVPQGVRVVEALSQLVGDPVDGVVNLAGENLAAARWSPAHLQRCLDSRVQATRRLIEWMQAGARPRVLISGSAIGWYGARGDELLDESAQAGRDDEFTVRLCRAWEAEALKTETMGVRCCRLRIGIVLERDGGSLAEMALPFRLGLGGPMGDGRQGMSWIHRVDLVAMILWLLDTDSARGAYNGTAPQPVDNRGFARALGRALHRPAIMPMPGFALKAIVGGMAQLVLSGQKVVPQRALAQGFVFRYPDLDSALAAIFREA